MRRHVVGVPRCVDFSVPLPTVTSRQRREEQKEKGNNKEETKD